MSCQQNNCNSCFNQTYQVPPIVMPTQVINRRQISFCEQPVIFPIECRQINQVILVPKYYRAYQTSYPTCNNCQTTMCCRNEQ